MLAILAAAALAVAAPVETARVGLVELFGTGGRDFARLRATLHPLEGAAFALDEHGLRALERRVGESVRATLGHPPADVAPVCCDESGAWTLYVGLPEGSVAPPLDPRPTGTAVLPPALVRSWDAVDEAWQAAVRAGHSGEDHASGHALGVDPELRRRQLAFRDEAVAAGERLYEVLAASRDDHARAVAAHALGYVEPSERQVEALARAARDPDEEVRNDAVRALWVLADSPLRLAHAIPADPFIALLRSGRWTDRNKGALALQPLSEPRPPLLLDRLRAECLADLVEMARWRGRGHADPARLLLGRVARIPEERLGELVEAGDVETIVAAALGQPGR